MSQNVQFGISKFPGIWTLALSDIVPLKYDPDKLKKVPTTHISDMIPSSMVAFHFLVLLR